MSIPSFDDTYPLSWWQLDAGWRAWCHGIQLVGHHQSELRERMRRELTRKLLKEHDGLRIKNEPMPAQTALYTETLEPAPFNPLSLELARYIRRHGGHQELEVRTGINISSLRRLSNPFYWKHSVGNIEKLAQKVGHPITVTLTINPDDANTTPESGHHASNRAKRTTKNLRRKDPQHSDLHPASDHARSEHGKDHTK